MKNLFVFSIFLILVILASGCATTTSSIHSTGVRSGEAGYDDGPETMALNYRDFEAVAQVAIQNMISSGSVDHPGGGRYVMVVSRVINDTMQRLDTDQLTKKIRTELLRSGKVVTTTAIGVDAPEDQMTARLRDLRSSDEVDQSSMPEQGKIQAPDLSLSGKIIQRNLSINSRNTQVEYYLQLTLTDVSSGLAIWEDEVQIIKRGSSRTPTW